MPGRQGLLFYDGGLSPKLHDTLRRLNPWWEGDPMPSQPETRRHLVARVRRLLEAEIAPIVVVRGPRQVGKTPTVSALADEARQSLGANVGSQRVNHYLKFLGETLLLRLIPPLEIRLKRKRGSPKLCLVDHGLRAGWLQEQIPLTPEALAKRPELTTIAGHLAESIFGSVTSTIPGLDIAHFPERGIDREVDFVLTVGVQRIPIQVKYQRRIDPFRDTLGIRSFLEKNGQQRQLWPPDHAGPFRRG